jgi:V8-like Glu-specific endopeptidase
MLVRILGAGALAVVAFVVGCSTTDGGSARESAGSTSSAIQGGTNDTTHTYAVGVCRGSGPRQCSGVCSGTLIAPNLILTARHCVAQSPQRIDCASSTFGSTYSAGSFWITTNANMFSGSGTAGWYQARSIRTTTSTRVCGNDVALIILNTNIGSTPVIPAVQVPMTDHSVYSTTLTAIGYGINAPGTNTSGTRRIRQNIDVLCIPGDPKLPCPNTVDPNEFFAGAGTCSGDSGSGAYEQTSFNANTPYVFGVLSRGEEGTCDGAAYERVDAHRDLIVNTVREAAPLGGYSVPSWTQVIPPKPDGGTPTTDGGKPAPTPGELGAACANDTQCKSKSCKALDGEGFTCTQACDESKVCPEGFSCEAGFCFAAEPAPEPAPTGTTTQPAEAKVGGCAVADPSKPIPWKAGGIFIGLGLVVAAVRRVRRRHLS